MARMQAARDGRIERRRQRDHNSPAATIGVPIMRALLAALLSAVFAFAAPAQAQDWPARQIDHRGAVRRRRLGRSAGPHPRHPHAGEVRPGGRGREPRRRRRQHRHRLCRQGRARRLHAAARHRQLDRGQRRALHQAAVRRGQGPAAGHPARQLPQSADRQSQAAGEERAGADRLPEGERGQGQLRLVRASAPPRISRW